MAECQECSALFSLRLRSSSGLSNNGLEFVDFSTECKLLSEGIEFHGNDRKWLRLKFFDFISPAAQRWGAVSGFRPRFARSGGQFYERVD